MTRMHEEFVCQGAEHLGRIAATVTNFGDGPTLRIHLATAAEFFRLWTDWAEARTADEKLAVEEQMEMESVLS